MKHLPGFAHRYGPWAIVAGASEGLGAAFAESLAQRGLSLVLLARRKKLLDELSQKLSSTYSVEVKPYPLDLSDSHAIVQFLEEMKTLDIGLLVYNAAYTKIGNFVEQEMEDLQRIVDVNIRGPIVMTHGLGPSLLERGRGGIIIMSSLAGFQGTPRIATYAASKAFGTVLAEGLWGELQEHGIDVLASCAGAIRTPNYQGSETGKEAPGTLDARDVAEQTLHTLGRNPQVVPGLFNKMASWVMSRLLPRSLSIRIMKKNTESLS